jgi:hypothetical protein
LLLSSPKMSSATTCGIRPGFPGLFPTTGQVAHVLLTRLPLGTPLPCGRRALARLACIRRAASVHPEPGSNSPSKARTQGLATLSHLGSQSLSHSSVVKVLSAPTSRPLGGHLEPAGSRTRSGRARKAFLVGGVPAIVPLIRPRLQPRQQVFDCSVRGRRPRADRSGPGPLAADRFYTAGAPA